MDSPIGSNQIPGNSLTPDFTTQNLQSVLEQASSAIAIFERSSLVCIYANPPFQNLFSISEEQLIGLTSNEIFGRKNLRIHYFLERAMVNDETAIEPEFEISSLGFEGPVTSYYNIIIKPVTDNSGKTNQVFFQGNDVSSLVFARKKSESSEKQLHLIADAVPVLIAYVDKERKYRFNNKAYETWFGHKREEIYGKQMSEVLGEAAYKKIEAKVDSVLSGNQVQFESLLKYKDGGARYVLGTYVPHFGPNNEVLGFYVEVGDITGQQETTQALRESENRFRLMADSSPVMIWTLDAFGNSTYYNKKATEFTGHTEEELKDGRTWQLSIHPDDIDQASSIVGNAVKHKQPYQMECRMKRADGEWRWLVNHGMPRLNENNELIGYVGSSFDITERKAAEESLKESEERYQNFILQSTEGIWRIELQVPVSVKAGRQEQLDHFFRYAYLAECNDAMARMYGYNHSSELLNFKLSDFYVREDPETEAYFYNFIDSGYRVDNAESKELDRNGNTRYFTNNLVGVTENDMLVRAWGTQRDITAQKSAEERLASSEKYFRQLTDTVPVIIWITRPDGYCTYLNKNWYEYTGQTPGEAEGYGWLEATHPEDAAEAEELFLEANRDHKPYYMLYRLRNKSGEYRWAIDSGQPKFGHEGTFEGMVGTVTDVHEQKVAEDKIRENEQKFRTLAETLPQLVWMTDENGNQEYASSRWKEYSGIEPIGFETWKQMVHPTDMEAINKAWIVSLKTSSLYKTEARLKNKNGEYRWHFVQGEPITGKDGKVVKWIGAFTDIHDQKTLTEKLEALVADRTKELQRSNEDLQQFAHVASHDLKEPIRKIKMFGARLEQQDNENISDNGKLYLQKMQSAADRMYTMIDGVLMYSTLNAVTQSIEEVSLSGIINDIEIDLELLIQQKGATVFHKDLPTIEGASVLLYQLFYNLLNNSLKFSREGISPVISITASDDDGQEDFVEIIVKDNGIGFDPAYAERIFTTFERLHAKDKYDGTGLGLALCKKIAERHKGSIRAEGRINEGASFIITLPVNQKQSSI